MNTLFEWYCLALDCREAGWSVGELIVACVAAGIAPGPDVVRQFYAAYRVGANE